MTDTIMTITGYGSILSFAICVAGFIVLYRAIRYPSIDCSAYLAFSEAMVSPIRMDRNFLVVFENDSPRYDHEKGVIFYSYNLTLNLLRLFRPETRMRGVQWLNLGLYTLFGLTLFFYLSTIVPPMLALFFTLTLAAQVKLIATAAFIYSDILNFFLFGLSLLLTVALGTAPTPVNAALLGAVIGLCFRNRQSDLILIMAAVFFLILSGHWLLLPAMCLIGFAAINCDLFYQQFVKKEPALDFISSIIRCNMPHCNQEQSSPNLSHVVVQGLRQMIDIRGGKSLFTSTGVSMFLFPVSITALLFTGHFTGSAGYLLLCWLGFVAAILIIRENASDSTSFFHLRQAYVLLIIMHLFNALAFGAFLAKGWAIPCYTYLAIYAVNLAHQAYKIIRHQISDTIHEEGLHTHPKTPEPYSVVLRDYLTNLETPVVVMGSHMAWGEMHNFFQWNENLRSVDLETKVDDEIIATQIKRHGVTHIALTPMSWYPTPGKCSIRLPELGPLLKDQLIRHEISDDVTIFEVIGTAPGQRKEAI